MMIMKSLDWSWFINLGVGQVGFWSSQAKSSIFENLNFKSKYLSSQILAQSSRVKYQGVSQTSSQVRSKYLDFQVKPSQAQAT